MTMSTHKLDPNQIRFKMAVNRKNARRRGVEFNLHFLSMYNLVRARRCYYTGIEMSRGVPPRAGLSHRFNESTIDRIDNRKGYVTGNVVACCSAFNAIKSFHEARHIEFTAANRRAARLAIFTMQELGLEVMCRETISALVAHNAELKLAFPWK